MTSLISRSDDLHNTPLEICFYLLLCSRLRRSSLSAINIHLRGPIERASATRPILARPGRIAVRNFDERIPPLFTGAVSTGRFRKFFPSASPICRYKSVIYRFRYLSDRQVKIWRYGPPACTGGKKLERGEGERKRRKKCWRIMRKNFETRSRERFVRRSIETNSHCSVNYRVALFDGHDGTPSPFAPPPLHRSIVIVIACTHKRRWRNLVGTMDYYRALFVVDSASY